RPFAGLNHLPLPDQLSLLEFFLCCDPLSYDGHMNRLPGICLLLVSLSHHYAAAQVIEFESHGLKYQTLTRSGITVMFAPLPIHVREYIILQVAVSNGSAGPYVIKPEDF